MQESLKPVKVGILLAPQKKEKLRLAERINECSRRNLIEIAEIDPYKSLKEQNLHNIKFLLIRVHDYLNSLPNFDTEKYMRQLCKEVSQFKIIMVENIDVISLLSDRKKSLQMLSPLVNLLKFRSFNFNIAATIEIPTGSSKNYIRNSILENQSFLNENDDFKVAPFVVKSTVQTYDSEARYKMAIYFNFDDAVLDDIFYLSKTTPIVLQRFYNHGGVLYKMFIIGNKWHITTRRSIKNFDFETQKDKIEFFSNKISKINSSSFLNNLNVDIKPKDINCGFDPKDLDMLHKYVTSIIKCPLLGIDLILEFNNNASSEKNLFLIDINYFPGYDGFQEKHNIGDAFIDLFLDYPTYK